jgi:hypothetical protein
MAKIKNTFPYDLGLMYKAFGFKVIKNSSILNDWLTANYELDEWEMRQVKDLYEETSEDARYWNEEELKVKFVGLIFRLANIAAKDKIKVFYERPLAAQVKGYDLAVISDCFVATPLPFNEFDTPLFFLQEFKKKRGEKKDPEAQMLMAMLICQEKNQDGKPLYGGYLFGSIWNFTMLNGNEYSNSRQFDTTKWEDLLQIIFILRKLKEIILNR